MKIIIQKEGNLIRIYHNPREVIVRPMTDEVEIFNSNGTLLEKYQLVKKNLSWLEDKEENTSEILLKLDVK